MKIAIMQPYFFPYLGYWQLLGAVDKFVIYDDVNYFRKGFINRNSILVNGRSSLITLELKGASQNKKINNIEVGANSGKILKTIEYSYKKSVFFESIFPLILKIINNNEDNLAKYLSYSLDEISSYLELETKIYLSSKINKNNALKGEDKILAICESLGAKVYINSIGGTDLYKKENFFRKDIDLRFLKPEPLSYKQYSKSFIPNLSIIDVLMFNSKEDIKLMLTKYFLI